MLFVLTDGIHEKTERPLIIECVNNCIKSGMNTFGIGIGRYPNGIEKIFPQIVFSANPTDVMKGVSNLLNDNNFINSKEMLYIRDYFDPNTLRDVFVTIIERVKKTLFTKLCNDLSEIPLALNLYDEFKEFLKNTA